ncbi:MAG: hypothetical protein IKP86_00940 [Anaerolineaceae bacterium]|nr:hypothetical protein [Anaerolineaceae bacterium]
MSIINDFLEKVTGLDLDGSDKKVVERPCSNCPSNCAIAGEACTLCEPYKKKLIDTIYHVNNIDEFRAQYEVVSNVQSVPSGGTITCPRCGGPSANHYVCDYCGAKLTDQPAPSGKIQVSSASEIPNPIMDAQNIIYDRYNAIVKKYTAQKPSSGSFWSNLISEFLGTEGESEDSPLGAKMSEAEIKEAAALYRISVGDYLTGLDNGKYLTLNAKKEADKAGRSGWSPESAGIAGVAGIGMIASGLMKNPNRRKPSQVPGKQWEDRPQNPERRPVQPSEQRPPRPPQHPEQDPAYPGRKAPSQDRSRPAESSRVKPSEQAPSQNRIRPSESTRVKPSEQNRPRPERQPASRPAEKSENSGSDHWKERNPGRRSRG